MDKSWDRDIMHWDHIILTSYCFSDSSASVVEILEPFLQQQFNTDCVFFLLSLF